MSEAMEIEPVGEKGKALTRAADEIRKALLKFVAEGAGPVTGSVAYAKDRVERFGDTDRAIKRIINETQLGTGTSGFVTGLGGLATLPISVPASVAGAAMLNARMVAAIAHLRGYDIDDPLVQQLILMVVAGESAAGAVRAVGVQVGKEFAKQGVAKVGVDTVRAINKKVGFMLLAKYGTKRSAITLAKAVPVVGGLVGGTVDAAFTKAVGAAAKKAFTPMTEPA